MSENDGTAEYCGGVVPEVVETSSVTVLDIFRAVWTFLSASYTLLERPLDCGALEAKFSNGRLERELGFGSNYIF